MFGLLTDIVRTVAAPVQIVSDLTRVVTKPVADLAQEVAQEVSSAVNDVIK